MGHVRIQPPPHVHQYSSKIYEYHMIQVLIVEGDWVLLFWNKGRLMQKVVI